MISEHDKRIANLIGIQNLKPSELPMAEKYEHPKSDMDSVYLCTSCQDEKDVFFWELVETLKEVLHPELQLDPLNFRTKLKNLLYRAEALK